MPPRGMLIVEGRSFKEAADLLGRHARYFEQPRRGGPPICRSKPSITVSMSSSRWRTPAGRPLPPGVASTPPGGIVAHTQGGWPMSLARQGPVGRVHQHVPQLGR